MIPFVLKNASIYAVPVLHYTMELALHIKQTFEALKPDCVAVELPETLQSLFLHAASRLPDVSVVQADDHFYLCEPCDASFEGLRCALEHAKDAFCIDLDVKNYPLYKEPLPDPYSLIHIGLSAYYSAYCNTLNVRQKNPLDIQRELHMARRLKELSLHYDKILYIGGFFHVESVLQLVSQKSFELFEPAQRSHTRIATLTEDACREVMAEYGWVSCAYELWRENRSDTHVDRQKLIYHLYKTAAERYRENTGNAFFGASFAKYHEICT